MAGIDPVAYVRSTQPFDQLPEDLFASVADSLEVSYHPAGTWLVRAGGTPLQHLYVIRKGSVRLERDGQVLQVLEEGETFGYTSLITRKATLDVAVEQDLLAYRLPDAEFQRLLSDARFASHFAVGLSERLRASLEYSPVATFQVNLSAEVEQLVRREPVWVEESSTVGDAAKAMSQEGISSVLVRSDPPAILTDRDLRNRVLALGRGPETPVTEVYSRPLRSVEANTPVYQAWTSLLDTGAHHLPITRDGSILGVITSSDLLKHTAQGPVAVLRRIERLSSRDQLPGYSGKVTEMVAALLSGGLDAGVIAGFVARLNDTVLRRILHWAHADLGPAPVPYAWVVFGSEGRMEQTLLTDQDHALLYADGGAAHAAWFQSFADLAVADLETAGFPPCQGGHMANKSHGILSDWNRRFEACVDEPRPHDAALYFDFRRVAGDLDLAALSSIVARAGKNPLFLRFLARQALEFSPPGSLSLRLRSESSTVDLKWQGISPVVFLGRCYGIEVGSKGHSTLDRLEAAHQAGLMGAEVWSSVTEAYRFLVGLRLRAQLKALQAGNPATNKVALADLSGIERSRVKDSFRAIKSWQEKAAYHYQIDFA
jgi:CBS domain-containing protein